MRRREKRKPTPTLSERPSTRRRIDMAPTLNLVPDDLDDDTHDRLDKLVMDTGFEPSNPIHAPYLLIAIAANPDAKLSPRYQNLTNTTKLLTQYPALTDKLKEAWAKGSFRDIRRLGQLSPGFALISATMTLLLVRDSPP
jgi:hypothetical protein